jgi:hypothetical protein
MFDKPIVALGGILTVVAFVIVVIVVLITIYVNVIHM